MMHGLPNPKRNKSPEECNSKNYYYCTVVDKKFFMGFKYPPNKKAEELHGAAAHSSSGKVKEKVVTVHASKA
jgi:hypothetical protein